MQKSNAPTKLTVAFASGSGAGPVNTIPLTTNPTSGGASYQTGFTSVNMEPIASGGVPPYGADFNGLFQAQTKAQIWQQSGYMYPFDATFAGNANIGGYPAGSVLMMAGGKGFWLNQSDNNAVSPDTTGSTGWLGLAAAGTSTINTTGGTTTPDPSILGVTTLIITGALTSNATLVLPLIGGVRWIVVNNTTGSYTLTVQGSSGSGVSVSSGSPLSVFTDGTNYYGVSANLSGSYLPINGIAVAATKLATARTIAMTGDVAWTSPAFDGTSNVTATGTIQPGTVTLAKMANFQANSLMGNPTASTAAPSGITLGSGLKFSSSQLQLAPTSAQVVGWLGYTPVNKAGDAMTGSLVLTDMYVGGATGPYIYESNPSTFDLSIRFGSSGRQMFCRFGGSDGSFTNLNGPIIANQGQVWGSGRVMALSGSTSPFPTGKATCIEMDATTGVGQVFAYDYAASAYVQLTYTASAHIFSGGNVTINGNLTTTGTVNFNTSDETLKDEIDRAAQPQPLHRVAPFATYRRTDTGQRGRGPIAQDLQRAQPLYVGEYQHPLPNGSTATKLGIAQAAAALEEAWWCGRALDELAARVAAMESR